MYKINKGIDRPPEVLGIVGMNYIMIMAGSAVGLLLFSAILTAGFGISPLWGFGFMMIVLMLLYQNVVRISKRFGERGLSRFMASKRLPGVVIMRSSAAFRRLYVTAMPNNTKGKKEL